MDNNFTDNFELMDGFAIINSNFVIVTANETLYRFMGIATLYTIIDIIHQVDLDDFIDVANSLRPDTEKSMVVRMKRFDNSYRWMLIKVKRCVCISDHDATKEYLELRASDILAMEKERNNYRENYFRNNHIMSIQGSIYFTYYCDTHMISFYSYVDNKIMEMSECPLEVWIHNLKNDDANTTINDELHNLHTDFLNCKTEFFYKIHSNYFSYGNESQTINIKASTIFEKMEPVTIVGIIQNMDSCSLGYSKFTYLHSREHELFSLHEVNQYVQENITFNPKCQISLLLMEIDHFEEMRQTKGDTYINQLYATIIKTTMEMVGTRGVVGSYQPGILYIAIKNISSDLNTRAFLESLRGQISWNCKFNNQNNEITTSIGISRRPYNGLSSDMLFKKALRALKIANEKGQNRFIIFIENVHNDIEL